MIKQSLEDIKEEIITGRAVAKTPSKKGSDKKKFQKKDLKQVYLAENDVEENKPDLSKVLINSNEKNEKNEKNSDETKQKL